MLENIRRIGIFMIAAQTVVHFAARKQYEKYMKTIASVTVLLLFIGPFVSSSEDIIAKWQAQAQQMAEQMERQAQTWQADMPSVYGHASDAALEQIEEEIKSKLNNALGDENVRVTNVIIDLQRQDRQPQNLTGQEETELVLRCIKVVLQEQTKEQDDAVSDTGREIRNGKITLGQGETKEEAQGEEEDADRRIQTEQYRQLFAQTLGMAEDKVEVAYGRGW